MFLFNRSSSATESDFPSIFNIDELRQIVLAFPPPKRSRKYPSQEIVSARVNESENGSLGVLGSQVECRLPKERNPPSIEASQASLDIEDTPEQVVLQSSDPGLEHSADGNSESPTTELVGNAEAALERGTANRSHQEAEAEDHPHQEAFIKCWRHLEAKEIRLYTEGLESLADQSLQNDCANLLLLYLIQLIPKLIKSATKDASRDGQCSLPRGVAAKVQSFQQQLRSAQDLDTLFKYLNKFDRFLKTPSSLIGTTDEVKSARLQELCQQMEHDSDGPRLFLHLVVIMWSTSPGNQGLIYITGKFSPRLLKLLAARADKMELSEEEANRVRLAVALKDKVKDGALTGSDIQWMREAANNTVKDWEQEK